MTCSEYMLGLEPHLLAEGWRLHPLIAALCAWLQLHEIHTAIMQSDESVSLLSLLFTAVSAAVMQLTNTPKKSQFTDQSRQMSSTPNKQQQTPCKLLLVKRQNARWTLSEFLFRFSLNDVRRCIKMKYYIEGIQVLWDLDLFLVLFESP